MSDLPIDEDGNSALGDFKAELQKSITQMLTSGTKVDPLSPDGMDKLLTMVRQALESLGPEEVTRRLVCYYGPDDRTDEEKRQRYAPPIMIGWADSVDVTVTVEKEYGQPVSVLGGLKKEAKCTCPYGRPGAFRRTVKQQESINKCAVHGGKRRPTR